METKALDALWPNYCMSFESYYARAAWLTTFTWESELIENTALWTSLTKVWSNSPSYFQSIANLFQLSSESIFPEVNYSWFMNSEIEDDVRSIQELVPIILASLSFNSSHVLADKLISQNNSQILETPFHFMGASRAGSSRIPYETVHFGSAIEAIALLLIGMDGNNIVRSLKMLSDWLDKTRMALICVGSHLRPNGDCGCKEPEEAHECQYIRMLLQCVKVDDGVQHCLTPLQFVVYCLDIYVVKALLESGVDPNGLGARDGKSIPIYLYQVDDRWWSANPLHMLRHAEYAPEKIDGSLDIMESREAMRSDIETMLIDFGAQDFGSPIHACTSPEGCTGVCTSCTDSQVFSGIQHETAAFDLTSPNPLCNRILDKSDTNE